MESLPIFIIQCVQYVVKLFSEHDAPLHAWNGSVSVLVGFKSGVRVRLLRISEAIDAVHAHVDWVVHCGGVAVCVDDGSVESVCGRGFSSLLDVENQNADDDEGKDQQNAQGDWNADANGSVHTSGLLSCVL